MAELPGRITRRGLFGVGLAVAAGAALAACGSDKDSGGAAVGSATSTAGMVVVLNWLEELKTRTGS